MSRVAKMYQRTYNIGVKEILSRVKSLPNLCCFVKKVNNVAILCILANTSSNFVLLCGIVGNFMLLYGLLCTFLVFWACYAVLLRINFFVLIYALFRVNNSGTKRVGVKIVSFCMSEGEGGEGQER